MEFRRGPNGLLGFGINEAGVVQKVDGLAKSIGLHTNSRLLQVRIHCLHNLHTTPHHTTLWSSFACLEWGMRVDWVSNIFLSLSLSLSLSHAQYTHSLSHSLSLSHTHTHTLYTHTHTHTHSFMHTHTLSLSHTPTLHTHTHTLSLFHTHTHTHTRTLSLIHTHTLSLYTHTHTHTHTHTQGGRPPTLLSHPQSDHGAADRQTQEDHQSLCHPTSTIPAQVCRARRLYYM